jgi:hypothetical protein
MATIARPPCDGSSMGFIDGTVVNVALPALQTALHATLSGINGGAIIDHEAPRDWCFVAVQK